MTIFGVFVQVVFWLVITLLWIGLYRLDLAIRFYFWILRWEDSVERRERDDQLKRAKRAREDTKGDAA